MSKIQIKKSSFKVQKKPVKPERKEEAPKTQRYDIFFDILHLKQLMHTENFITNISNYMNKFFFKYGSDIFFDDGTTFNLLSLDEAKKKIPSDYKKIVTIGSTTKEISLRQYFESEYFLNTYESKLTIDYLKDYKFVQAQEVREFEVKYNYLNMKKILPYNYTRVVQQTDFHREGVKMFFDHIKTIICSGSEKEFSVVKKFLASSCAGHKVKIALYWQSLEQSGKGTVLNTMNRILGKRMTKTSSIEIIEKYNKDFEGCSLINLDEIPVVGTSKLLQDALKSLITEPTFTCRGMYSNPYTQNNTFNIIMTTNNNGIQLTQTNKDRYYVNNVSNYYCDERNKEEKKVYFDKLYKYLDNNDVLVLIYQEFMRIFETEVKPTNWSGAYEDLNTEAGKLKRMDAMPEFFKYIKKSYLSAGIGINEKCSTFIDNYNLQAKFQLSPHKIGEHLKSLNIEIKEVKKGDAPKYRKYILSYENLLSRMNELNYIDKEFDEFKEIENINPKEKTKPKEDFEAKYNELLLKYNDLVSMDWSQRVNALVKSIKSESKKIKKTCKKTCKNIKEIKLNTVLNDDDNELILDDKLDLFELAEQAETIEPEKLHKGVKHMADYFVDFDNIDDSTF